MVRVHFRPVFESFQPSGAVAQLGERLLCKQEVVGSIPSGSTSRETCSSVSTEFSRPLAGFEPRGRELSDIVKRRSIRAPLRPGSARPNSQELGLEPDHGACGTLNKSVAPDRPPSDRSRKLVFQMSVLVGFRNRRDQKSGSILIADC